MKNKIHAKKIIQVPLNFSPPNKFESLSAHSFKN